MCVYGKIQGVQAASCACRRLASGARLHGHDVSSSHLVEQGQREDDTFDDIRAKIAK